MQGKKDRSLFNYRGSIPEILRYQIITKACLGVIAWFFRLARGALLWTTGRSAATSGDLPFLMRSVQGWALLLLGLGLLLVYVIIDINAVIILSARVVHQKKIRVREILGEAFTSVGRFGGPFGLFLTLYAAFLLPLAGVGLGITLTDRFYIPDFITSVIKENWIYNALYSLVLLLILVVSCFYIFTFHCMIFRRLPAKDAWKSAGRLMKKNWKDFIRRYVGFFLGTLLIGIVIVAVTTAVLFGLSMFADSGSKLIFRMLITFSAFLILAVAYGYFLLFTPFQAIALTRIYESYTEEDEGEILYPERRPHYFMKGLGVILLIAMVGASLGMAENFDYYFPQIGNTQIIAHRGGGNLGNENTVYGMQLAIEAGADVSEIDVQRTKDGYYIVNHDDTFRRLAGEPRTAQQMTLEEIRRLSIPDNYNIFGESVKVATFEEMLDAAKDRIRLYVELKGRSADSRMAEELYQIVYERGMLEQVTFICLKYEVISRLEKNHPDAVTGYLCYASSGDLEDLDVDELILEEETATPFNIEKIHAAGKLVGVWTVNTPISMVRFYARNADAIITDDVNESINVRDILMLDLSAEYDEELDALKRVLLRTMFVWWP